MRREKNRKSKEAKAFTRTTIFLTQPLDFYLDYCAIREQRPKGELVREAVTEYLAAKGYKNLDRVPDLTSLAGA